MPGQLAVDFGTTNTVVTLVEAGTVRILHLPGLAREQPLDQSPLIPTAVYLSETVRPWLFFRQRVRQVQIGQQALNQNYGNYAAQARSLAQSFKPFLGEQPHRPVAQLESEELSAQEAAFLFLRELLAAARQQRLRITDLTIPTPVGYYEPYRAALQAIAKRLKVRRFRTLDEPVAAALGYGVNIAREETLLVVDFGGGTLDLAAVRLGPGVAEGGAAQVLAKHMVRLGGSDVDRWLLEHVLMDLSDLPHWEYHARWEAMRVKEQVSREGAAEFRWNGISRSVCREDLVRLLDQHGLYRQLRTALAEIRQQLAEPGASPEGTEIGPVDQVLLVGGSTLLPEVAAVVDESFPKAIVRHDPALLFTAVALGAARFAGGVPVDDHIYHDYALAVQNDALHQVEYERLVPCRTRYPTAPNFAVRYYADFPGMTEMRFGIHEVGRLGQTPVAWQQRANGNQYWSPANAAGEADLGEADLGEADLGEADLGEADLGEADLGEANLVELNPGDSPLLLRPTGQGTSPRLRVTFSVNADRWLCMTVEDLVRKETLRMTEPVVRLR